MFQPVVPPRIDEPTLRFCNVGCAVCVLPSSRFCNVGCAVCVLLVSPELSEPEAVCPCWGLLPCSLLRSYSSQSANSLRTESCLHLYLPCVRAVAPDDRTCSSVPGSKVIKLFSCSTQLSMKFQMLINIKIAKINDILWFRSPKLVIYPANKC